MCDFLGRGRHFGLLCLFSCSPNSCWFLDAFGCFMVFPQPPDSGDHGGSWLIPRDKAAANGSTRVWRCSPGRRQMWILCQKPSQPLSTLHRAATAVGGSTLFRWKRVRGDLHTCTLYTVFHNLYHIIVIMQRLICFQCLSIFAQASI